MKRMKARALALVLTLVLALGMTAPVFAAAEDTASGKIQVVVSMDANTLGLGYLIKPTLVTVDNQTQASVVITDLLKNMAREKYGKPLEGTNSAEKGKEYAFLMTGSVESAFYLAHVYCPDQKNAAVADYILAKTGADGIYDSSDDQYLGEFDYYSMSGWMYSISDGSKAPSFPGVGAADWKLSDGEVMRWQFTVYGYGSDLNADNSAWGSASLVPTAGNKTGLTRTVAELRSRYQDSELETNSAYQSAMRALTNPIATQAELDKAETTLRKVDFADFFKTGMSFIDVKSSDWYYSSVRYAFQNKLFSGTSDLTFSPDQPMTRGMFATVLHRMAGTPAAAKAIPFRDVAEGSYYTKAAVWAHAAGILSGTASDTFGPNGVLTREQMATALYRYAQHQKYELVPGNIPADGFTDQGAISEYARPAMAWAIEAKLLQGNDHKLTPRAAASRAQVASVLQQFAENVVK